MTISSKISWNKQNPWEMRIQIVIGSIGMLEDVNAAGMQIESVC
jgi:hypothetical protein